ncbi:MAG: flagellar type III secretion system pore protein FliP, partial [Planctomycetes bacterium]|nr:flagellar type III secretion system pore protein FliP [Planctomycetota bacterium]
LIGGGLLERVLLFSLLFLSGALSLNAQDKGEGIIPTQDIFKRENNPDKVATTVEIVILLTILTLAPTIIIMVTAFTRIVIVLSFIRRALATQELPPNQIIIGLSLILTFVVMYPVIRNIKTEAVDPYLSKEPSKQITQDEALKRSLHHMREFMFIHARAKDIKLFLDAEKREFTKNIDKQNVPTHILVPAFVISELRRAFIMGFALFLPFMVIDIIVSVILISMGMLVLPPILISLPFKILLFILVDGWNLLIGSIIKSFQI